MSDYTVVEALTGQEGYLKALEHSPDLVITGLRLPDIGGDELLYRLRGEEALNRSKLMLYVSGKIQKTDTYLMGLEIDIGELASRPKILLGDKLLLGKTGGNPL